MKVRSVGWRQKRRVTIARFLIASVLIMLVGLVFLHSIGLPISHFMLQIAHGRQQHNLEKCATVEEMGEVFRGGFVEESLRVREIIHQHFTINGAQRVRELSPEEFCKHGFVLGKASEAGFANEMYKILTGAALSVMLNRSLIIGQTRHIGFLSSLSFHV